MSPEQFKGIKRGDVIKCEDPRLDGITGHVILVTDRVWINWHYPSGNVSDRPISYKIQDQFHYSDWLVEKPMILIN